MNTSINPNLEIVQGSNDKFTAHWIAKPRTGTGFAHFKNNTGYKGTVKVNNGSENMTAMQLLFSARCGIGFVMKMAGISFSEYCKLERVLSEQRTNQPSRRVEITVIDEKVGKS